MKFQCAFFDPLFSKNVFAEKYHTTIENFRCRMHSNNSIPIKDLSYHYLRPSISHDLGHSWTWISAKFSLLDELDKQTSWNYPMDLFLRSLNTLKFYMDNFHKDVHQIYDGKIVKIRPINRNKEQSMVSIKKNDDR